MEARRGIPANGQEGQVMRQPVPKALERDDRWRVALLAQRHDHVAQDGQPGRRSFGLGTTVRVELPGNLGEPVRVGSRSA